MTRQSTVSYDDGFDVRVDPRGGRYYWMTGEIAHKSIPPDTDMAMLERGFITITPLQYDLTDNASLGEASRWVFDFRPPGAGEGGKK
ncbi:MAG: hypothetical protein ACYTAN_02120 [Planctomycetota bacterium]